MEAVSSLQPHVLAVDDDASIRELVAEYLTQNDLRVTTVANGKELDAAIACQTFDLVILDLRLPDEDGMQIAHKLRQRSSIPILVLTGRCEEADRVMGLELGADDYLTKPFSPRELLARIRALLRRSEAQASVADEIAKVRAYRFGNWELNVGLRKLKAADGGAVELTNVEFGLLTAFLAAPQRVLTRDELLDLSRLHDAEVYEHSIDVQILRLQSKIERDPAHPHFIRTERGEGYVFHGTVEPMRVGPVGVRHAKAALLVVDDNETNRYALAIQLAKLGYENVTSALDGSQALALMRQRAFDLVLLDFMMPELNGYELLAQLKADERLRHVPVIMISALDQPGSVIRCIELGADDLLPKPIDPTLLRARVGASLERKRLHDELVAHLNRTEQELLIARDIQLSMVPVDFPEPSAAVPVEIFATLKPARQVGGDLYDFFFTDQHTLTFVVADVSDKGAPAALFMARIKTLIRLLANFLGAPGNGHCGPDQVIAKINEELCRDNRYGMFATAFFGTLHLPSRTLAFCNAGHNPPYILTADGGLELLEGPRCKPIGVDPSFAYAAKRRSMAPDDCLFLFTDGITEAMNAAGESFEAARLERCLRSLAGARSDELVNGVVEAVGAFAASTPQWDDIAAMAVRLVETSAIDRAHGSVQLVIRNSRDELARVAHVVDDLGARHGVSRRTLADVQVALDEILSNILEHGYDDDRLHEIRIRLNVDASAVEAEIEDDGRPFNPLDAPPPRVGGSLDERDIGGMGIHLVRHLMSEVAYRRLADRNRLVLKKRGHDPTRGQINGGA